ncbi:MAG: hypothetical protein IJ760_03320 [Bacteroidales bacterium]|nr:hypothetical protein [Bacteroidales bacterium]
MKKRLLVAATFLVMMCAAVAQQRSVKVGYNFFGGRVASYSGLMYMAEYYSAYHGDLVAFDADLWQISRTFSMGLRAGINQTGVDNGRFAIKHSMGMHYGVVLRCHTLAAICDSTSKWDVSIDGMLGSYFSFHFMPQTEYSVGLTVTYYPWQNFGFYAQAAWGEMLFGRRGNPFVFKSGSQLGLGVSYRF